MIKEISICCGAPVAYGNSYDKNMKFDRRISYCQACGNDCETTITDFAPDREPDQRLVNWLRNDSRKS